MAGSRTLDLDRVPVSSSIGRSRRVFGGVASSIASRAVAALAPLLLVPLTLDYLGAELYGLWVSILALTSMALWADLGLGNGLLTQLVPVLSAGERQRARRLVSTGYAGLGAASILSILVLFVVSWVAPWSSILGIERATTASSAPLVVVIAVGGFLLNIPLSLIQKVQYASQQVWQSNAWQAVGSAVSVITAWAAVEASLSIYWVIGAVAAGPLVGNLVNSWWFYGRNPDLLPRLRDADRRVARSMFGLGSQFFLVSIMSTVALNVDSVVIAHMLGLEAVAAYSVPVRALTALGLLVTLINMPLWPANGEALAQGDIGWVRHITRRMTLLSAFAVLLPGLVVSLAAGPLFSLWLGASHPAPPQSLVVLIMVWWVCTAAAAPRFMVQNAVGRLQPQVRGWALFFLLSLTLKIVGAQEFGLQGVVVGSIVAYIAVMWPTAILGYRGALRSATVKARES